MKLKLLRKHYKAAKGNKWIPKLAFESVEEIEKVTGYDPKLTDIYDDCFCGKLHISTPPRMRENSRK